VRGVEGRGIRGGGRGEGLGKERKRKKKRKEKTAIVADSDLLRHHSGAVFAACLP